MCTVWLSLWITSLPAQVAPAAEDMLSELASRLAAIVGPGTPTAVTGPDPAAASDDASVPARLAALLAARGVRASAGAGDAPAVVTVSCRDNLRERACVAQVDRGGTRTVVVASRPHGAAAREEPPPPVLRLRRVFEQRSPILDAAVLDERLLVLDAASLTLYEEDAQGWQRVHSRLLPPGRTWPRHLRGRLRADDDRVDVFLPGLTCSGPLTSASRLECGEGQRAWPLGLDNTGLDLARNHFTTPDGLPFYAAAPLGAGAGARWLVADPAGTLTMLDAAWQAVANVGTADDVAGVVAPCDGPAYVVVASHADGRDSLGLFQAAARRLVAAGAPVALPGRLTALWGMPGASTATAIVYDPAAGRYEAFLASVDCRR
jgi:hypothetical protein